MQEKILATKLMEEEIVSLRKREDVSQQSMSSVNVFEKELMMEMTHDIKQKSAEIANLIE